jgi:L-aspartate oxidase
MWENAGIVRSARGLHSALDRLAEIGRRLPPGATEELNMMQTAELVAQAALRRKESRGGHYRADHPRARGAWTGRHIEV